ncbi:MAG: DUF1826 domain-containing protein [Gemmataceae bacterium]
MISAAVEPSSCLWTDQPDELKAIHEPHVLMGVLERTVPPGLREYIDEGFSTLRCKREVTVANPAESLDQLFHGLPAGAGADLFRADIHFLARLFHKVVGAPRAHLKLEAFQGNLCERFHTDNVPMRLICCYLGPGTQWLDYADVNRDKLGPGSGGLPDEQSGLIRPGAIIHQLPRFAVGLMKGNRWPGNSRRGLVHRSPRAADPCQQRVLLKIE